MRRAAKAAVIVASFGAIGDAAGGRVWLLIGLAFGIVWSLGDFE